MWIENDLLVEDKCEQVEIVRENGDTDLSLGCHYLPHQRMDDVGVDLWFSEYDGHKLIV